MNIVSCENCATIHDFEKLREINATKNMFLFGKVHKFWICQNCGEENESIK